MNAQRLTAWLDFKREVQEIRRAQASVIATPMEIGAFQKGGGKGSKGKDKSDDSKCSNCGRPGHWRRDCRAPGGGAYDAAKGQSKGKDKGSFKGKSGKGKGKSKGSGKSSEDPTCWKCGAKGHIGKDCPSRARSMNALSKTAGAAGAETAQDMSSLYMASLSFGLGALDVAVDAGVDCRADGQAMRVGIDSGAARSVVPNTWYTDYPVR